MAGILAGGVLDAQLRESIAVATAGKNGCAYCASAHTAIGKDAGIDDAELRLNLAADSSNRKVAAALSFVDAVIEDYSVVPDSVLASVRDAGFSEQELVEIIAHVGMNSFTNMFNVLARTAIDFPLVELTTTR